MEQQGRGQERGEWKWVGGRKAVRSIEGEGGRGRWGVGEGRGEGLQ